MTNVSHTKRLNVIKLNNLTTLTLIKKYSIITNLGIRGVWNRMALRMLSNEDVWAWGVYQCLDVVNGHHLTLNRTFVCLKILRDFNNECLSLRIRNEFLASHYCLKPFHCNVFRQPEAIFLELVQLSPVKPYLPRPNMKQKKWLH